MRPVLLLLALLLAGPPPAAHAASERGKAAKALKTLIIRPMDAPAECSLQWRSTPYWLKPGGRLLDTVVAGWIGTDAGITPDALRLGISGVYFESETHTFAIIGFDFKTEKDAITAEKTLEQRFAGKTEHRFVRKGTYVVVFALPSPTNNACAQWMWEELGRRLDKVAT
jgi:hypothetical protein